jgi:glycosyltransferase involved in cell wall biosynthesis
MAARRKVGIVYQYDEGWIGGSYYVQNLIAALNKLADAQKPEIHVVCSTENDFNAFKKAVSYDYLYFLSVFNQSFYQRAINKITRLLSGKNVFNHLSKVECFFPINGGYPKHANTRNIYWIPDFQEEYYPQFFPEKDLNVIRNWRKELSMMKGEWLVLSSHTALKDYLKFYPDAVTKNYVMPFAVNTKLASISSQAVLLAKYGLPERYFIAPNQFWRHKNQQIILDAVKTLKQSDFKMKIVFTGKESDPRNPDYVPLLKQFVTDNGLQDSVSFLGFIDRQDQLQLIKHSLAVIQPSRFEGWSSVIEDAKSMNKIIIASAIDVHKEQLGDRGYYFNPDVAEELAALLKTISEGEISPLDYHYGLAQQKFAEDFYRLITSI